MLHSCDWLETVPLHQQRKVSQFKTRPDAQRKRAGRKATPCAFRPAGRPRRPLASANRGRLWCAKRSAWGGGFEADFTAPASPTRPLPEDQAIRRKTTRSSRNSRRHLRLPQTYWFSRRRSIGSSQTRRRRRKILVKHPKQQKALRGLSTGSASLQPQCGLLRQK
jgi:hypothetical protein